VYVLNECALKIQHWFFKTKLRHAVKADGKVYTNTSEVIFIEDDSAKNNSWKSSTLTSVQSEQKRQTQLGQIDEHEVVAEETPHNASQSNTRMVIAESDRSSY
jgi:hypothetical protein